MSRPLPELLGALATAPDYGAALTVLNAELESDKKAVFALLTFDGRRHLILGQRVDPSIDVLGRAQIGLDHLPTSVRQTLVAGDHFADVGDQSSQYARILGLVGPTDECRLYLRGMVLDGSLVAILAAVDGRRRVTAKLLEKVDQLGALFHVTFARLHERDARFEAVTALHELTTRLRETHVSAVNELEREIARLREARGDVIDRKRVEQLQAAAENAKRRAATAERRLAAVEQQVASAVERLERAHMQLHQQTETLQLQSETIQALERQLAASSGSLQPTSTIPRA